MAAPREVLLDDPIMKVDKRQMDNGETRHSATCSGGSAFIRTTAALGDPEWQNAHHHKHTSEFYVVVTGWMAVAEQRPEGQYDINVFRPGQWYMSRPGLDHNILVKPGADIDTHKFLVSQIGQDDKPSDWYDADPVFDRWSKALKLIDIAEFSGVSLSSFEE